MNEKGSCIVFKSLLVVLPCINCLDMSFSLCDIKLKTTSREIVGVRMGLSEMQGCRNTMEDDYIMDRLSSGGGPVILGVLDGHGGPFVS
jgi:hypothetical protein